MTVLNAEGVNKSFDGLRVLNDAWIDVPDHKIIGLIGPNGAGKSTFLTVLSKFAEPDSGRITSMNTDVTRFSPEALARHGVVRTFQVPREFGELSVLENLIVAAKGQAGENLANVFFRRGRIRSQEAEIRAKALEVIDFLGLSHVTGNAAKNLSGGQKKLLELGRALMTDPALILLDEPFAGVAPGLVDVLIEKIHALRNRGMAILIVEHNMEAVHALCDRVYVMVRGSILVDGTPAHVSEHPKVLEAYLGSDGL